jgi:carboxyl-terminal processing protease
MAATPCDAQVTGAAYEPLMSGGAAVPEARGVWQSRGYGWIVALDSRGMTVYQASKADCSMDPRTDAFMKQFLYRQKNAPQNQLIIVQYPGENRYVFDRIARLPEACTRGNWDAKRLFEHFAASYQEQYAFFMQHNFDWNERVDGARALVTDRTSPRVLFAIFSDMLDGLGDAHVGLNATFRGEPVAFRTGRGRTLERLNEQALKTRQPPADVKAHWLAAYQRGVREDVLRGQWHEASGGKVVWGSIGSDIGYINVSSVENFAPGSLEDNIRFINALLDRILTELGGVKSVILDITNNTGGSDRLAREIAGHFAAARVPAYSKQAYGAQGVSPDMFYAEPSVGRRFTGPTYLLTSDVTVSGGEILTMTMRVLPNVSQVGMATRGALSDRLTKVLPDGSDFSISNEIYLDPREVLFEGTGLPPHQALEIFPAEDLEGGHAKAVQQLIAQIRAGTVARPKDQR